MADIFNPAGTIGEIFTNNKLAVFLLIFIGIILLILYWIRKLNNNQTIVVRR